MLLVPESDSSEYFVKELAFPIRIWMISAPALRFDGQVSWVTITIGATEVTLGSQGRSTH